jgi:hypothetical protein
LKLHDVTDDPADERLDEIREYRAAIVEHERQRRAAWNDPTNTRGLALTETGLLTSGETVCDDCGTLLTDAEEDDGLCWRCLRRHKR